MCRPIDSTITPLSIIFIGKHLWALFRVNGEDLLQSAARGRGRELTAGKSLQVAAKAINQIIFVAALTGRQDTSPREVHDADGKR